VGFDYRRSDQPTEGFRFHLMQVPCKQKRLLNWLQCVKWHELLDGCIRFHRAEFLDVFVNNLPDNVAHFGKRLVSYVPIPEGYLLSFADGTSAECDVVIGADGLKSVARSQMFSTGKPEDEQYIKPVFTNTVAYRGLIPADALTSESGHSWHRSMFAPMMASTVILDQEQKYRLKLSSVLR
jgi:salicylate hydroxylase